MKARYLAAGAVAAAAFAAPAAADLVEASAMMMSSDGKEIGMVRFSENGNGLLIRADLSGLPAGMHAFHLHETGSCEDGFDAAGKHFNPTGREHGLLNRAGAHAGDLPNIWVAEDGRAVHHVVSKDVTLTEVAPGALFDSDGSAVVIHENPDDYESEAGAGGRIACGVIEPAS